ncbi:MAG: type I-U CRISPR-associated protein Csx17 [Thiotrichales bacterium]
MPELILKGCAPAPLAHYLKALGVLRLVAEDAEQGDPDARGYWCGEHFVLESRLDQAALCEFFLRHYRPTPIVAPWNGGSGFYPKDNKTGIDAIAQSETARFQHFQEIIAAARSAVRASGLSESPKDAAKRELLARLRNELPDPALQWLDAAVLIAGEGELRYPPLLGTGGNDGRLDFTNNLMQRLGELISVATGEPLPGASGMLAQSLFDTAASGLSDKAIGQFAPGAAGGPNASTGFDAAARINPWDFVLMLEGAMLFAAAATRKLEQSNHGALAYPFTVRATGAGSGSAATRDEDNARAEIWLPLWAQSCRLDEVRTLLAEGRASLGHRSARDGLDFARAVATLGVDRGIAAFQRIGFLMRSGKAYLATPLGRFSVRRNPDADLIAELDRHGWLDAMRRFARSDLAPRRIAALVGRLEDTLFSLTQQPGCQTVQESLCLLGELHLALAASRKGREALHVLPRLSAAWALRADDGSAAYRIAIALSGIHAKSMPMRAHILPLDAQSGQWLDEGDARRALNVWSGAGLVRNLLALQRRRLIEASRGAVESKPFESRQTAGLGEIGAFLACPDNDASIARLIPGLVLCDLSELRLLNEPAQNQYSIPGAYAVLRALFTSDRVLTALDWLPHGAQLVLEAEIPTQLAAGQVDRALNGAWRRLRAAGCPLPDARRPPMPLGVDPQRLAAALMIPLNFADTGRLLRRIAALESTTV